MMKSIKLFVKRLYEAPRFHYILRFLKNIYYVLKICCFKLNLFCFCFGFSFGVVFASVFCLLWFLCFCSSVINNQVSELITNSSVQTCLGIYYIFLNCLYNGSSHNKYHPCRYLFKLVHLPRRDPPRGEEEES